MMLTNAVCGFLVANFSSMPDAHYFARHVLHDSVKRALMGVAKNCFPLRKATAVSSSGSVIIWHWQFVQVIELIYLALSLNCLAWVSHLLIP